MDIQNLQQDVQTGYGFINTIIHMLNDSIKHIPYFETQFILQMSKAVSKFLIMLCITKHSLSLPRKLLLSPGEFSRLVY